MGGLGETTSEPSGRAVRPEAASSVAPVPSGYEHSLRPCLGTSIAPRRRATFRQALLVRSFLDAPLRDVADADDSHRAFAVDDRDVAEALLEHDPGRLFGGVGLAQRD